MTVSEPDPVAVAVRISMSKPLFAAEANVEPRPSLTPVSSEMQLQSVTTPTASTSPVAPTGTVAETIEQLVHELSALLTKDEAACAAGAAPKAEKVARQRSEMPTRVPSETDLPARLANSPNLLGVYSVYKTDGASAPW